MSEKKTTIIAFMLQGKPHVILEADDLEQPYAWPSIKEASKWFDKHIDKHFGIAAASSVIALDVDSGESETLL